MNSKKLTNDQTKRYTRQLMLPEIGVDGQILLHQSKVLCVGLGGLGSIVTQYLTAAGIGTLGLLDDDMVELSNLQRQILHYTDDIGKSKLDSAAKKLKQINPHVKLQLYPNRLKANNALDIIKHYDLVVDGSDNFSTRYIVNDACVLLNKINIYASILKFEGQITTFNSSKGPCYRCLFPQPATTNTMPNCAEAGVLATLPGICGTIQATEAIKCIINKGQPLIGRLLIIDALTMKFTELYIKKNVQCPICSKHAKITDLIDYPVLCTTQNNKPIDYITPQQLKKYYTNTLDSFQIIDVREPHETAVSHLDQALLIPLRNLTTQLHLINPKKNIIIYCLTDGRSQYAARQLLDLNYKNISYLKGGIKAWAKEIDTKLLYLG